MKALCWQGTKEVEVAEVPAPAIERESDVIIKVLLSAISGADLHIYNGLIPKVERGDILGHEFMGEVVELGRDVTHLTFGDKVVVPGIIACGRCWYCERHLWSSCASSNRNAALARRYYGCTTAGIFGFSQIFGGYAGGQAEYVRVPFADVNCFKVAPELPAERLLFLAHTLPTAWMAAENAIIEPESIVAVWGCGAVGQFAIQAAWRLGAARVIAIDMVPERLKFAERYGKAETVNIGDSGDLQEDLHILTGGHGVDCCIDAVGMDSQAPTFLSRYEQTKQKLGLTNDVPESLREAIMACRPGGHISIAGRYATSVNHLPLGAAFAKSLTLKMGPPNIHRYLPRLLKAVENEEIDPSFIITDRLSLDDAPQGYERFNAKKDGCLKVVLRPT